MMSHELLTPLTSMHSEAIESVTQIYEPLACAAVVQRYLREAPGDAQVLLPPVPNAARFPSNGSCVSLTADAASGANLSAAHGTHGAPGTSASGMSQQVTDRGPGVSEHFGQRVFQRFAQADMHTSRQKGGSALGLYIAKQMIEHMQGSIGYSSQPGCTTFHVILPEAVA